MENYIVGSIVKGEVTGIEPYGIFVKVDDYNGLIHISEIANNYISNITKYVNIGERIYAKVIEVDTENNRLNVLIDLFGQETPVEVELFQVNKLQ